MIGKTISHYKILEKLGEGGMGEVYLAEDTKLKRKVALKFLPKEFTKDKDAVERFQREAQAAATLNHPNIVTIYEINQHEDQTYIAMEYVEGQTLKDIIQDNSTLKTQHSKLALGKVIDYATQICDGLHKAHEAGIVHRDIKPQNILIDKDGRVKILDFGLAKLKGISQLTKERSTLGTIHYMSPEQALGKDVDHATDIWSLGVVLVEMLTGQLPFKGDYEQAVIYSIINEEPEPISNIRPEYPDELMRIVKKTLEKKSQNRYQNIDEMKKDLRELNLPEKPAGPVRENDMNKTKKKWNPLTVGLLILILMAIIGIGYMLLNRTEKAGGVIDSLAVLPLENLSGDPEQDYFSDGMTEALITELSRIKALKVISRTSVMRFKNTKESLPEIARQLNVAAIIEGSVLKAGDRVRITTQLIEAESDKHLWAESYERDLKEILSLQKEVARTIASQIKATLTPAERDTLSEVDTIDPVAHEAFLKGHHFYDQITVEGARKAIEFFDRVIELEPKFAPAYAGKAKAFDLMTSLGGIPSQQGWIQVRNWAKKTLQIDPDNAEALMLMADVKYLHEWDWPGAEQAFKKSIELNPNNATAYNWYAVFLSSMGRNHESIPMVQKALELAPLSIGSYSNAIWIYLDANMVDEAEALFNKFREIHPNHPQAIIIQTWIYLEKSEYKEALQIFQSPEFQKLWPSPRSSIKVIMARIYIQTGNEKAAREILEDMLSLSRSQNVSPFSIAILYSLLGENDRAFTWMDKAYNQRSDMLAKFLKSSSPLLDNMRPDPRFQELLKKMKLDQ